MSAFSTWERDSRLFLSLASKGVHTQEKKTKKKEKRERKKDQYEPSVKGQCA
jgi:hypothetical protein